MTTVRCPWLGAIAAACFILHDANHVLRGTSHDVMWACNVATPLIAIGCIVGRPVLSAIGLSWLTFGTPIWLLDLGRGAGMIATSPLVHVIAPLVSILAHRHMGWPRNSWMYASLASVVLLVISRLVGDARPNVNLAFRVHDGWEATFPSHLVFLMLLVGVSTAIFFVVDRVAQRTFPPVPSP